MKNRARVVSLMLSGMALVYGPVSQAATDVDASAVTLKTSCMENGVQVANCFEDLNSLNSWIWNTRNPTPSASSPLLVQIGPGVFIGNFTCNNQGFVTLSGSGMRNTVLSAASSPISTFHCDNMVFKDMTLKNTGNLFGVRNLGGSTFWSNIEIEGFGYAWFDSPSSCPGTGVHYWFNSRILAAKSAANSATAYFNGCDESWFFGSEITARGTVGSSTPLVAVGGEVHVYGSVIRAVPEAGAAMTKVTAVTATSGAEIHIHGTGIDTISDQDITVTALDASNGGVIHANQSSYVLKTGSGGEAVRIRNTGGRVMAPYQWENGAVPPAITSVTGADSAIISETADGHPHLVIYDSSCASGWYDSTARACQ